MFAHRRRSPAPPFPDQFESLTQLTDMEIDSLPGEFAVAQPADPALETPATDPRFEYRLERTLALYSRHAGPWRRIVAIHHAREDRSSARRIARLGARLLRLHRARLGRDPHWLRNEGNADVWLLPDSPVGGRDGGLTWRNQIYLFGTTSMPTPLEWVRTLAHEWGHLCIPAARGYRAPENDAAGYLGERLYLGWLREDLARGALVPEDGTSAPDLELYYRRQIGPLAERFRQIGPGNPTFHAQDAQAMDLYIGAALAMEEAVGSALLGQALYGIQGERPADFLMSLRRVCSDRAPVTFRLPAWVPFPEGNVQVCAATGNGRLAIADGPSIDLRRPVSLRIQRSAFHFVRSVSGNLEAVTLARKGSIR